MNSMKKNMGIGDRLLRVMIAAVFAWLYATDSSGSWIYLAMMIASVIFVLTSVVSFCPLYTLLGINTCKRA